MYPRHAAGSGGEGQPAAPDARPGGTGEPLVQRLAFRTRPAGRLQTGTDHWRFSSAASAFQSGNQFMNGEIDQLSNETMQAVLGSAVCVGCDQVLARVSCSPNSREVQQIDSTSGVPQIGDTDTIWSLVIGYQLLMRCKFGHLGHCTARVEFRRAEPRWCLGTRLFVYSSCHAQPLSVVSVFSFIVPPTQQRSSVPVGTTRTGREAAFPRAAVSAAPGGHGGGRLRGGTRALPGLLHAGVQHQRHHGGLIHEG